MSQRDVSAEYDQVEKDLPVGPDALSSLGSIGFTKDQINQSIPARFERMVTEFPNNAAVKYKSQILTYDQLNKSANGVAHAILERRGAENEPIGLLLGQGVQQVTAILGILKAGKMYIPLDPSFPLARLSYMLEDSQARVVVANQETTSSAREWLAEDLDLVDLDQVGNGSQSSGNPDLSISPDSYANILYTSGSTGQAKGVLQNHRNLLHGTWSVTKDYEITPDDRISLLFSTSYAASITPLLASLLNGASLHPLDLSNDLTMLSNWLVEEGITIYISVPTLFRQFASTLNGDEMFPHLRRIVVGGEPVLRKEVDLYKRHFSDHCKFVVRLAGTEMHRIRSFVIDKDTVLDGSVVPVGYQVDDKEIVLLDEDGQQVPQGEEGEIVVKSRYLSPGYWRRPKLTREKFLADVEANDRRIYHTGDLGRLSADGCLTHLGRKDSLVKIRGFRIELGEIESLLLQHEAIRDAIVVVHERDSGEKQLVSYLVARQIPGPTPQELRSYLSRQLPDYMVPVVFMYLESLPLTPTGKVSRRDLPEPTFVPERSHHDEYNALVGRRDSLELQLTQIWEQVLGVHPIDVTDNFFELGGSSLLAVRLFKRIEELTGINLPLATLVDSATIEDQAQLLREDGWSESWSSLVPLQTGGSKPPFFCVHGGGGNVIHYRILARHLGPEQPFYGLQPQGMDGNQPFLNTVEEMAAHFIEEIQSVAPRGPYYLGGYCFGATIAFEMAHQLTRAGEQVALLVSFGGATKEYPEMLGGVRDRAARIWRNLTSDGLAGALAYVREKLSYRTHRVLKRWKKKFRKYELAHRIFPELGRPQPKPPHHAEMMKTFDRAKEAYEPDVYPGRLILFRNATYHDAYLGWGELAEEGIEVYEIPCVDLMEMFQEPHVKTLADRLSGSLNSAYSEVEDPEPKSDRAD